MGGPVWRRMLGNPRRVRPGERPDGARGFPRHGAGRRPAGDLELGVGGHDEADHR